MTNFNVGLPIIFSVIDEDIVGSEVTVDVTVNFYPDLHDNLDSVSPESISDIKHISEDGVIVISLGAIEKRGVGIATIEYTPYSGASSTTIKYVFTVGNDYAGPNEIFYEYGLDTPYNTSILVKPYKDDTFTTQDTSIKVKRLDKSYDGSDRLTIERDKRE